MHLSSWLLSAGILSTGVSAFYPIKLPKWDAPGLPNSGRRRFYPVVPFTRMPLQDEKKPLTLDLVKVPRKVRRENKYSAIMGSDPRMENSVAVNQDGQDYSYFSVARFGSGGQEMWLLLDSGASESWVMGSNCTAAACLQHNRFGIEHSKTLSVTDEEWEVSYGTGHVEGVIVRDTLSMAGFQLELDFGSALNVSQDFANYPMDGILGLGPSKITKLKPILQVIADQKLFKRNIFGISLQRAADDTRDGQLTFGDIDKSKFTGDITYTDVIKSTNRWEIPVSDAIVGGKRVNFTKKSAVIDTGTSFILVPMKDAEAIHALIPGSSKGDQYFTIPCDTNLSLEIEISGTRWTVSPKDYVGNRYGDSCNSYILPRQALGPDQWLLGDTFLKNVYSVFDYDESRIGFAAREYPGTPPSNKSTPPNAVSSVKIVSEPTTSPVPPRDANANPIEGSSQPSDKNTPDKEGVAAFLSTPGWLSLAVFFSTGYSWYLSSSGML
uniref:Probable aspartic-type endopeptidase CTSD n=3 Tax=Coccidioides posadasii TaxID=199306 RepID=A0A0J6FSZ1_COCPO|nr:cathepsin E [Coccidioides posadasii RMSCC 3488]